jgi:hypothetical protein
MAARKLVALAGALAALALIAPSVALAGSFPGVTVIGQENEVLAIFKTAKCTKGKPKKAGVSFYADSTSTNGEYELLAAIVLGFTGFHKYDLTLSTDANPYLRLNKVGDYSGGYSNEFVPPYPVPGFGQINFSSTGKRMGIGFGPAMWSRDFSDAVVLAGGLECRYPKKSKH